MDVGDGVVSNGWWNGWLGVVANFGGLSEKGGWL